MNFPEFMIQLRVVRMIQIIFATFVIMGRVLR